MRRRTGWLGASSELAKNMRIFIWQVSCLASRDGERIGYGFDFYTGLGLIESTFRRTGWGNPRGRGDRNNAQESKPREFCLVEVANAKVAHAVGKQCNTDKPQQPLLLRAPGQPIPCLADPAERPRDEQDETNQRYQPSGLSFANPLLA